MLISQLHGRWRDLVAVSGVRPESLSASGAIEGLHFLQCQMLGPGGVNRSTCAADSSFNFSCDANDAHIQVASSSSCTLYGICLQHCRLLLGKLRHATGARRRGAMKTMKTLSSESGITIFENLLGDLGFPTTEL